MKNEIYTQLNIDFIVWLSIIGFRGFNVNKCDKTMLGF